MKTIETIKRQNEELSNEMNALSKIDGKDKKAYASARRRMTAIRKKKAGE